MPPGLLEWQRPRPTGEGAKRRTAGIVPYLYPGNPIVRAESRARFPRCRREGITLELDIELEQPYAPAALSINRALYEAILTYLIASAPLEGVGLLAVAAPAGLATGSARAVRFYPGANIDASPARYTMDPVEVLTAFRDMDARGWRLGAIVHSHPATPAIPSATDLREAHYPDALMVIVSLARHPPETRAWRMTPDTDQAGPAVTEVAILVEECFEPV